MSFRDAVRWRMLLWAGIGVGALAAPVTADATLPAWLQHIVGASSVESALYRAMQLPGGEALYPRPPKEAAGELGRRIADNAGEAELYQLRARAEEQALDEGAAESDWKLYVAHAAGGMAARMELADFYERRLMVSQEVAVLGEVAAAPPLASETYVNPTKQRSWLAFERMLGAIDRQGLPPAQTASTFQAFLTRYPDEPAVYEASLQFEMEQQDWAGAQSLIERYSRHFPEETIFPVRAQAMVMFRRGNVAGAMAVYDHGFEPLWPAELIRSYFALMEQTHGQRVFVAAAREQLAAHPDGPEALNAVARIFFYDQQGGRNSTAQQTLDAFRIAREARNGAWTATDLETLARLSLMLHSYAEAARYDDALAASNGTLANGEAAAQAGLAGLIEILLEAPEQPLAVGAQNLTLYRDIATVDQGPGYWNGILSLWLNGAGAASEYRAEGSRAQSYFHREKAAELLADLDRRFPAAVERPGLHAEMIRAIAWYGEPASVISAGKRYLADFPSDGGLRASGPAAASGSAASGRLEVASLMADAYARQNDTAGEFALYEGELRELAARTGGLPLTSGASAAAPVAQPGGENASVLDRDPSGWDGSAEQRVEAQPLGRLPAARSLPEGAAYASVLDRYLGRLTATGQLPRALMVLRAQLDRNPNDPLLYERLAMFFEQNNLSAQQEQIYQQALAKFQQPSYYDKLARLYLRERKREAFGELTRKVTDIFSGTELDDFFASVSAGKPIGPQLALQLNLYAAKRFPHDLVFVRNLLGAYQASATRDSAEYEALLRREWWESDDLREAFLRYLSRTGKLEAELSQLESLRSQPGGSQGVSDPAAMREEAEIDIFRSHFEQAAPLLGKVADLYPADPDTGDRAVSLYRSLAYFDGSSTVHAVAVETNLLAAAPDSAERLATLGDLYAEATSTGGEDLVSAAPYWRRIPELHPGTTQGFLTSATIFWDYFAFDDALAEVAAARVRFHAPSLFGYEAGAIEENRHHLAAAVAEYTGAVVHPASRPGDSAVGGVDTWFRHSDFQATVQSVPGSTGSKARLIELGTRSATRGSVDSATAKAVAEEPGNLAALALRAEVLAAQHPAREAAPLLSALFNQALDRGSTVDEAAAVGALAEGRGLVAVYESALAKEAALTLDPVQKIELQYALARSLESHEDLAGATRIVDAVHAANPRILGVVRSTTDFYVRTKRPAMAVATLLDAARVAAPALARDFTLEAAGRANDAGDTAQARRVALGLLRQTPYDARVLGILAASYAGAHDDAGLKQFYLAELDDARHAPGIADGERKENIAVLRRGLIPALTRLSDYPGATDQYIALLSAFPEDANLVQEAATYALKYSRQSQLVDFLRATVKQSPQDSRFMILLAGAEVVFEDLPAAEAAYSLAIHIRKDRVDLYTARAEIEMRLSQSDGAQTELAAADFERLYTLTYHDPSWMVRVAELRARQQRPAEAVKALQAAYVEGHTKAAADCFRIAALLEQWNLLGEARNFAEQGAALAGPELLTGAPGGSELRGENGGVIYARVLTRAGEAERGLAALMAAREAAELSATSPSVLAAELARENISGDEAAGFRQNFAAQRRQVADQNLRAAIDALGRAVEIYYTPEQKQGFGAVLDKLHASAQPTRNAELALQAATAAGLADREAEWRRASLPTGEGGEARVGLYVSLQQRRLEFAALGRDLEGYAGHLPVQRRRSVLTQAAQAFRDAGDGASEVRLLRSLAVDGDVQVRSRYFDLLLRRDPAALTALAGSRDAGLADAALNYTVAEGSEAQALGAVANRGRGLAAVWRPASASLVRTYFAGAGAGAGDLGDFEAALAVSSTIGARVDSGIDPARQLTGDIFFQYASRFGIYLATVERVGGAAQGGLDAEDFLPGALEGSPGAAASYLDLARTYVEAGNLAAAVAEYGHAVEVSPSDAAIEDELATTLYRANRRDEALAHWHRALAILGGMQRRAMYPESWFTSLEAVLGHLGEHHLSEACRAEVEGILGPYLAKNGSYRSNELLKAVYRASVTGAEGAKFVIALAGNARDPNQILEGVSRASWLGEEGREAILLGQVELVGEQLGGEHFEGSQGALGYQHRLIELYLAENRVAKAQAIYDSLSVKDRKGSEDVDGVILAVRGNRLQALMDKWRADPESVPKDSFGAAMYHLMKATPAYTPDLAAVRPLQEFIFEYKRQNGSLVSTDFLALAQLRLEMGDLPGALDLLRQVALRPASSSREGAASFPAGGQAELPGDQLAGASNAYVNTDYANTDYAAAVLEKSHRPAEAVWFLQRLVKLVPWDASYRLRLAEAEVASGGADQARGDLTAVARDATAPYELRVQAARALAPLTSAPGELGSGELFLIVHSSTVAAARQPYFAEARIAAAATASGADRELLLREAIAIHPGGWDADRARLTLLLQQPASADSSANLAILGSIQNAPRQSGDGWGGVPADGGPSADASDAAPGEAGAARNSPENVVAPAVALPAAADSLDRSARVRLATVLALANEREGDLGLALGYAQLAIRLAADQAGKPAEGGPELTRRRDEIRTAAMLAQRNRLRRPELHEALAQPNQVRPRLTASTVYQEQSQ